MPYSRSITGTVQNRRCRQTRRFFPSGGLSHRWYSMRRSREDGQAELAWKMSQCISWDLSHLYINDDLLTYLLTHLNRQCDNYNLKSHRYVCITTYQPNTKCNPKTNPNPNATTKRLAIVNTQLNIVTCPTYPDKFIWDVVVAPSVRISIVIVTLPLKSVLWFLE